MLQLEGRRNGTVTGRSVQQHQKLGVENRRSGSRYCQVLRLIRAASAFKMVVLLFVIDSILSATTQVVLACL